MLSASSLAFTAAASGVDEDAVKAACADLPVEELAERLADAKALALSDDAASNALVIGSDQILVCEGRAFDKPKTMADARARIATLSGKPHDLVTAVSVARAGEIVWRHTQTPRLWMRTLKDEEIDAYLARAGEAVLSSVGAYQIEGVGGTLFDRIEGDYNAILGMPLSALLAFLRTQGVRPH